MALRAVSAVCALGLLTACTAEGTGSTTATAEASSDEGFFDDSLVHDIEVTVDEEEYEGLLEAYRTSGDKEWVAATVTIDGTTFEEVGLRLKGNSSLRGVSGGMPGPAGAAADEDAAAETEAATDPESLPWLIRLDKYVDGQDLDGLTELVVRSNGTESSLNEAVALELVGLAGLATQEAVSSRFSVNGSDEVLRLVVENPSDEWDAEEFDSPGVLYKAEAGGDYSYRGEDPESYVDVFDQETGTDTEDLGPLIDFLQFINESDDETFAAELADHLDVDAFARYLAVQDLLQNQDDIDGPGNNSYLRYDEETGRMTVVTWDLNLALGVGMGGGAMGGPAGGERPEGFEPPEGFELPDGAELPEGFEPPTGGELPEGFEPPEGFEVPDGDEDGRLGGPGGGGMGGSNVLVERFLADDDFAAAYATAQEELRAELYDSGAAAEVLERWAGVLADQAADLVDSETLATEVDAIAAVIAPADGDEAGADATEPDDTEPDDTGSGDA